MEDINKGFVPRALKPLAPASNSPVKSLKAKGKMRESAPPPSAKSRVGGIFNFFGPNPIIPPRPKKTPVPVAKPNLTGRASGKRTLAEVMEQDIERKKKPRQSYSPVRTAQSKFFAPTGGVRRRHSDGVGASGLCSQEKENILPQPEDVDDALESELGASDQSMQVNFNDPPDIMEFDLTEFADAVEQEDGYISPSPSDSRDADELSSPPQAGRAKARHHHRAQQGVIASFTAPPTGFLLSDDDDDAENSFGADIVSSPVSVKRPTVHKPRAYAPNTPIRVSVPRGSEHVLVQPTPTPANGRRARADVDEITSPTQYRGLDLRSMLDDDGLAEHELEEALLAASGSASSPSPSPDTPDPSAQAGLVRVIDVDDLQDEEQQLLRASAERANAVMVGWRERWALPAGKTPAAKVQKEPPAGARTAQLRRSETNVTPAGRHTLKAPRSAPPRFNVAPDGARAGSSSAGGAKRAGMKPRRSLVFFEAVKQTGGASASKPMKATVAKKGRQVVDLTMSDPVEENEIFALSPPKAKGKPAGREPPDEVEYNILAHAQLNLSQFR